MTRRDYWLGVLAVCVVLVFHALMPRYEWRVFTGPDGVSNPQFYGRVDRWTGQAELRRYDRTALQAPAPQPVAMVTAPPVTAPVAVGEAVRVTSPDANPLTTGMRRVPTSSGRVVEVVDPYPAAAPALPRLVGNLAAAIVAVFSFGALWRRLRKA